MTTHASDDLTPHLTRRPAEAGRAGKGVLLTWDPDTFRGTVAYNGAVLTNPPLKMTPDALSWTPGTVVDIVTRRGSLAIDGRWVTPGTEAADKAVRFMRAGLAKQLSRLIFAEGIKRAGVADAEPTVSGTYGDLATPGPTVPDVEVGESGTAVVLWGASVSSAPNKGVSMSFAVSGASTVAAPASENELVWDIDALHVATALMGDTVTGLNPGLHTFTAKYRSLEPPAQAFFADRFMIVIGL
jgi:hypothetical protein